MHLRSLDNRIPRVCAVSVSHILLAIYTKISSVSRPKILLKSRFSTPYTFFCLICTISSELKCILSSTHLNELWLISAGFQWTGSTPAGFRQAFRVDAHKILNMSHVSVCLSTCSCLISPYVIQLDMTH